MKLKFACFFNPTNLFVGVHWNHTKERVGSLESHVLDVFIMPLPGVITRTTLRWTKLML